MIVLENLVHANANLVGYIPRERIENSELILDLVQIGIYGLNNNY